MPFHHLRAGTTQISYVVSHEEVQICTLWQTEEDFKACLGQHPVHNQETSESTASG